MEQMIKEYRFALPPFCDFTPEEWQEKGHDYDEVRENMLGWDITDYGMGDFTKIGFSLITIRNGNLLITVYNSTKEEDLDKEPGLHHDFNVEEGTGSVLIGEVSQCNDDNTDNRF
ncbi:MAG: D-lyxose/D-mannose family sugar isomerase [Lachnospiraceae bacterium]|nr:D-lyxose/D-mannose family sugar isomerase [Lachnospiraceae bacterium]